MSGPHKDPPFRDLPLDLLYELLVNAVQELLEAMEINDDNGIAVRAKKKQLELIHASILAKQTGKKSLKVKS